MAAVANYKNSRFIIKIKKPIQENENSVEGTEINDVKKRRRRKQDNPQKIVNEGSEDENDMEKIKKWREKRAPRADYRIFQDNSDEPDVSDFNIREERRRTNSGLETFEISQISSYYIQTMLNNWKELHNLVKKWHPFQAIVDRAGGLVQDDVMEYFGDVLEERIFKVFVANS